MSRVGRQPIDIPAGVKISFEDGFVMVNGKLGEMGRRLPDGIKAEMIEGKLIISRSDDSRDQRSLHGLTRTLVANMVKGVSDGFQKNLEVVGVGYKCEQKGRGIQMQIGFSHRVLVLPPDGVKIQVTGPLAFNVSGIDKEAVGEVAAKIRAVKPPEPYKGKGIKYAGEVIRRKAGKSAGK